MVRASAGARLLVIGYAQAFHLGADNGPAMAATVLAFRNHLFHRLPLPHPSWCNTGWLTRNPWFRLELLPALRERARALLQRPSR